MTTRILWLLQMTSENSSSSFTSSISTSQSILILKGNRVCTSLRLRDIIARIVRKYMKENDFLRRCLTLKHVNTIDWMRDDTVAALLTPQVPTLIKSTSHSHHQTGSVKPPKRTQYHSTPPGKSASCFILSWSSISWRHCTTSARPLTTVPRVNILSEYSFSISSHKSILVYCFQHVLYPHSLYCPSTWSLRAVTIDGSIFCLHTCGSRQGRRQELSTEQHKINDQRLVHYN